VRYRICVAMVLAAVAAPVLAIAQSPEAASAVAQLEASRDSLLASIEGMTPEQWQYRESEDRWSAHEIVEHLALNEDVFYEMITQQVMKTERRSEPLADAATADGQLMAMVTDRSQRFQAPEVVRPRSEFATPREAVDHFVAARERTLEFARNTPDLRLHAMSMMGGPDRDAVQWLTFVAGHTIRHTAQLQQVKDHPGFPKR
jgi:hypothetical protein